jgi:hypothetical protein
MKSSEMKYTHAELTFLRRARRHGTNSAIALGIPYFLGGIILAGGNYLSEIWSVDPDSVLFRLWPFNQIYLQQFAFSHYTPSEVRWFFAVVSYSNLVWMIFLCWKFIFDSFWRDIEIPTSQTPNLAKIIFQFLACVVMGLLLSIFVFLCGFYLQGDGQWGLSLGQSIATGAFKLVMVLMPGFYVMATCFLEFGGLGLRYLLAKRAR